MKLKTFLVTYFVVAVTIGYVYQQEPFPVFTGQWFHKTPVKMEDYGIKIKDTDGLVYFEHSKNLTAVSWKFAAYGLIQDLGESVDNNNSEDMEKFKNSIFSQHLKKEVSSFQIFQRKYKSLDFMLYKSVLSEKVLYEFKRN